MSMRGGQECLPHQRHWLDHHVCHDPGTRMSQTPTIPMPDLAASRARPKSFASNATLIGAITLLSRLLGMARESIAANYFGANAVYSAFTFAFTIPNLFRKLLGEGALSAAFIPLYAQAVKREQGGAPGSEALSANDFAAASVNLLCSILLGL